jgi:hypothetical protein
MKRVQTERPGEFGDAKRDLMMKQVSEDAPGKAGVFRKVYSGKTTITRLLPLSLHLILPPFVLFPGECIPSRFPRRARGQEPRASILHSSVARVRA